MKSAWQGIRQAGRGGIASCLLLTACAAPTQPQALVLSPVDFAQIPGWAQGDYSAALTAFRASCHKPAPRKVGGITVDATAWERSCRKAAAAPEAGRFFAESFQAYVAGGEGLLTGYYEPLIHGSLTPDARFRYPVWGVPSDFKTPYLTRSEIEANGLQGKAKAVLYVDDPIALFFLHVQGSGRVVLPDGRVMGLAYAAKNGQPYTAIGKILIERGEIPRAEMTAERLKSWLAEHPDEATQIMQQNDSYVFFTLKPETQLGAVGAAGVALTPEASLAVDPGYLAYGLPVYVNATLPDASAYNRLTIAQDTGSAIKGPVRGDMFFGHGTRAEQMASAMKQPVRFYVLLPKHDPS